MKTLGWVPLKDGSFVTPRRATLEALVEGFSVDAGYKWLEAVEFGAETSSRMKMRSELGFDSEAELELAQDFVKLVPKDQQERCRR